MRQRPQPQVPAEIIVNDDLEKLLLQEFHDSCCAGEGGNSFIPALRQAANVAALPGIVGASLAMPDVSLHHLVTFFSGYPGNISSTESHFYSPSVMVFRFILVTDSASATLPLST